MAFITAEPHRPYILNTSSLSPPQRRLYQSLLSHFQVSRLPCLTALNRLNIRNEVETILVENKLRVLLEFGNVFQYKEPTCEFIATFEAITNGGDSVVGWRFHLGSSQFTLSRAEVCTLFGFTVEEGQDLPNYEAPVMDLWWREFSDKEVWVSGFSPEHMKGGAWRYLARLISQTLNQRKDGSRHLIDADLQVLIALAKREEVDWFIYLTKAFTGRWAQSGRNKIAAGGLFVSLILNHLGFDMTGMSGEIIRIDLPSLARRGDITSSSARVPPIWKHNVTIPSDLRVKYFKQRFLRTEPEHPEVQPEVPESSRARRNPPPPRHDQDVHMSDPDQGPSRGHTQGPGFVPSGGWTDFLHHFDTKLGGMMNSLDGLRDDMQEKFEDMDNGFQEFVLKNEQEHAQLYQQVELCMSAQLNSSRAADEFYGVATRYFLHRDPTFNPESGTSRNPPEPNQTSQNVDLNVPVHSMSPLLDFANTSPPNMTGDPSQNFIDRQNSPPFNFP